MINGIQGPFILDLFCGAGGAAKGYHDAGFQVVGADISMQNNYPYPFVQADWEWALENLEPPVDEDGRPQQWAAIHASPPCQFYSAMSSCRPELAAKYPDLIGPVRVALEARGLPYVIENVVGAPLKNPVTLCGFQFGRDLYRHRLFETNFPCAQPRHLKHTKPGGRAGHWKEGEVISVAGNCAPMWLARQVMEISWSTRAELVEAIPPFMTEYIGGYLMEEVRQRTGQWAEDGIVS